MKILVIGSQGFIGRSLSKYLSGLGNEVWCSDIVDSARGSYVQLDGSDPNFDGLISKIYPEIVVNCSGAASVPDSLVDPLNDFALNTYSVIKLLEAMRQRAPHARFVNLSSAAVYGNPNSLPISSRSLSAPLSPYGFHKRMSELACEEYCSVYSLKTVSLRIFSAFGEGLRKQLFWDLHQKVKRAEGPIELFGTGRESRDFIYIKDLIRAIKVVADRHPFDGSVVNVASGREIFIDEAVSFFLGLYEHQPEHRYLTVARTGDPLNWLADISEIKDLGFVPEWTLERGLKEYHRWLIASGL